MAQEQGYLFPFCWQTLTAQMKWSGQVMICTFKNTTCMYIRYTQLLVHPWTENTTISAGLWSTVFPWLGKRKTKKEVAGAKSNFTQLDQIKEHCLQGQLTYQHGQTREKFGFPISLGPWRLPRQWHVTTATALKQNNYWRRILNRIWHFAIVRKHENSWDLNLLMFSRLMPANFHNLSARVAR